MNDNLHHISHRLTHISVDDDGILFGVIHPITIFPMGLSQNPKLKFGPLPFFSHVLLTPHNGLTNHVPNIWGGHRDGRGFKI